MGIIDRAKAFAHVGAAKAGRAATDAAAKGANRGADVATDAASKGAASLNDAADKLNDDSADNGSTKSTKNTGSGSGTTP